MSIMAQDANGNAIQCLRPASTEKIASTATASSATAVAAGVDVVRIITDAAIHYSVVGTATSSDVLLPANSVEYIRVIQGDVVSVIGTANVYITEMI